MNQVLGALEYGSSCHFSSYRMNYMEFSIRICNPNLKMAYQEIFH